MTEKEFEAGFREHTEANGVEYHAACYEDAAAYYATLQERKGEGMTPEQIMSKLTRWIREYGDVAGGGLEALIATIQPLTVLQPRPVDYWDRPENQKQGPVESVEGGKSISWSEVKEIHNNMDGMEEWVMKSEADGRVAGLLLRLNDAMDTIAASRLIAHEYAETIGYERAECQELLDQKTISSVRELEFLRAELDDLKANSIPMPKWEDAPDDEVGVSVAFRYEHEHDDIAEAYQVAYIPRPTPEREMTPEEMAEAWRKKWLEESPGMTMADANEELLRHLIDGKSIDQLLEEIK